MKKSAAPTDNRQGADARKNQSSSEGNLLGKVDLRLRARYGTKALGNLADPLDELIFVQLSIRTPEKTYTDVFRELHNAVEGNWGRFPLLNPARALAILAGGGMARVKLERLRGQITIIEERFGRATLDPLREMSDDEAEAFLLTLPGVGPKAARCVLMYSLGRQVFPVDSHCLRIMRRLELIPADLDRKAAHDVAQALVPPSIRHSLHVNMVHHGRELCRPTTPDCESCPLLTLCPTGLRLTS